MMSNVGVTKLCARAISESHSKCLKPEGIERFPSRTSAETMKSRKDDDVPVGRGLDCLTCRVISTATCAGGGTYVLYVSRDKMLSRRGKGVLVGMGVGLYALGAGNWYIRGDEEALRRVNRAMDRAEDRIREFFGKFSPRSRS